MGLLFITNALYKQKRAIHHGISNIHGLKVRRYTDCLIKLNKYLDVLLKENISDKICVTELNSFLLNIIPNSWRNHAYVNEFDSESIASKS